jgi:hypothetical protein
MRGENTSLLIVKLTPAFEPALIQPGCKPSPVLSSLKCPVDVRWRANRTGRAGGVQ